MESLFVLLGLLLLAFPVIAIAALLKSVGLSDRVRRLEARIAVLERRPVEAAGVAAAPVPPPVVAEPPPVSEPAVHEPVAEPAPAHVATPAPAAAPEPATSFEERFGTRWVVWIGGLALALGGIFLVRYSIEAGLLGPGTRLFFGALLAAALIAAGEWTRRQEQLSGFSGLPAAHIPGILTAAGTTA